MRKGHVALFIFPHYPHVTPTLSIVSTFVRRGYRTTYVTSDTFRESLLRIGAEVVLRPGIGSDNVLAEESPDLICEVASRTLSEAARFYEKNRPDLVVYDVVDFAGRILANRWNIPAVQIAPHFAFDRHTLTQQIWNDEFRDAIVTWSKEGEAFLKNHGIHADGLLFHRERLNIYPYPKILQPPGVRPDDRLLYAGRCPGEQPSYGSWNRDDAKGKPVVLVTASTTYVRNPNYYTTCIEAFSGTGLHVIFSLGVKANSITMPSLPDNFQVIRGVSYGKVLPHADVLICQGGTATVAEAAYHGVPILVLPYEALELQWNAENIAELGMGFYLKKAEVNARSMREHVMRLLTEPTVKSRARQVMLSVRREPGGEEVVNSIEALP